MRKRDLRRRLERDYGRVPDTHYFPEDMGNIRAYFDYRRSQGRDAFLLDETTWNDLDLDRLFRRINPRLSTSGEQYLYYLLRSPALDAETWRERQALAALMAGAPKRRAGPPDDPGAVGLHSPGGSGPLLRPGGARLGHAGPLCRHGCPAADPGPAGTAPPSRALRDRRGGTPL